MARGRQLAEPRAEKGFDLAVTRAAKVVTYTADATTEAIADEMKEATQS
jgi:hypothetical protein